MLAEDVSYFHRQPILPGFVSCWTDNKVSERITNNVDFCFRRQILIGYIIKSDHYRLALMAYYKTRNAKTRPSKRNDRSHRNYRNKTTKPPKQNNKTTAK